MSLEISLDGDVGMPQEQVDRLVPEPVKGI
jgi:hypothetical protein